MFSLLYRFLLSFPCLHHLFPPPLPPPRRHLVSLYVWCPGEERWRRTWVLLSRVVSLLVFEPWQDVELLKWLRLPSPTQLVSFHQDLLTRVLSDYSLIPRPSTWSRARRAGSQRGRISPGSLRHTALTCKSHHTADLTAWFIDEWVHWLFMSSKSWMFCILSPGGAVRFMKSRLRRWCRCLSGGGGADVGQHVRTEVHPLFFFSFFNDSANHSYV